MAIATGCSDAIMVGDPPSKHARSHWRVLVGILLVSLNLRPAVVSIPPLLETIRMDLALSYTTVSLLTAIPVLCMGVFAFATSTVTRALGRELGVFWAVFLIGVATVARVASTSVAVLFVSTVLVGIGIAICQTLLPSLVSRYFQGRVAFATGLYTASLTVGAALATGLSVPLQELLGSWQLSLASWAALALVGVFAWFPVVVTNPSSPEEPIVATKRNRIPWREPFAWTITLLLAGAATIFYSGVTWLAPRYVALGWSDASAGALLSVFVFAQLGGMFTVSAFGDRTEDRRPWFAVMIIQIAVGTGGIAIAPTLFPWAWSVIFGIGIGGLFSLALTLPVDFTVDRDATDRLSAMAMGVGFIFAALGPFVVGAVRDVTGGFTPAFVGLTVVSMLLFVLSLQFSPGRPDIGS